MQLNRIMVHGNHIITKTAPKQYETHFLNEWNLADYTGQDFWTIKVPGALLANYIQLEYERTLICDKLKVGLLCNAYSLTIVGDVIAENVEINTGNLVVNGSLTVLGDVKITGGSLAVTGNIEVNGAISVANGNVVTKDANANIAAKSIHCQRMYTHGSVTCGSFIDAEENIYAGNGIFCFGDICTHGYIKTCKGITALGEVKAGKYIAMGNEDFIAASVHTPKIIKNI